MLEGVTISESKAQKDEYILEGSDVQNVSQSGLCGHQSLFSHRLTSFKLHRFKASVVCGTRISVNSWTVSTFRTRAQSCRSNLAATSVRLLSAAFPCRLGCRCISQKLSCRMSPYHYDPHYEHGHVCTKSSSHRDE